MKVGEAIGIVLVMLAAFLVSFYSVASAESDAKRSSAMAAELLSAVGIERDSRVTPKASGKVSKLGSLVLENRVQFFLIVAAVGLLVSSAVLLQMAREIRQDSREQMKIARQLYDQAREEQP